MEADFALFFYLPSALIFVFAHATQIPGWNVLSIQTFITMQMLAILKRSKTQKMSFLRYNKKFKYKKVTKFKARRRKLYFFTFVRLIFLETVKEKEGKVNGKLFFLVSCAISFKKHFFYWKGRKLTPFPLIEFFFIAFT